MVVLVVLGYPGQFEDLDEVTQQKELRPRTRKGLDEIAYRDRWEGPLGPASQYQATAALTMNERLVYSYPRLKVRAAWLSLWTVARGFCFCERQG